MNARATSRLFPTDEASPFGAVPESLQVPSNEGSFARDFGAVGMNLQLLQADVEGGLFARGTAVGAIIAGSRIRYALPRGREQQL